MEVTPQVLMANLEWMRRLARRLIADPDLADDAVQDACVVALSSRPRHGNLRAWLGTVVRNSTRNLRRREGYRRVVDLEERATSERSSGDLQRRGEIVRSLVTAVFSLADHYRDVLLLLYFEQRSATEAARELGVPDATVRGRHKRALELLREQLDRERGGDREAWRLSLLGFAGPGSATKSWVGAAAIGCVCLGFVGLFAGLWWTAPWAIEQPRVPLADSVGSVSMPGDARATAPRAIVPVPAPSGFADGIDGLVLGNDGRPLPSVDVLIVPADLLETVAFSGPGSQHAQAVRTRTNEAGIFRVDRSFERRAIVVAIDPEGHAPLVGLGEQGYVVEVPCPPSVTLRGAVVGPSGRGIASASVRWEALLNGVLMSRTATTDATGRFELEDLPASDGPPDLDLWSSSSLLVTAERWSPTRVFGVLPRSDATIIELNAASEVRGVVLDEVSGAPIVGARVCCWATSQDHFGSRGGVLQFHRNPAATVLLETVTAQDGAFAFPHRPETRDATGQRVKSFRTLAISAAGHQMVAQDLLDDERGTVTDLTVRLSRGTDVFGRVLRADGTAAAGQRVTLAARRLKALAWPAELPFDQGVTSTDAEGRYRFVNVGSEEERTITVTSQRRVQGSESYAEPDASGAVPDVVLTPSSLITVRVVDEAGLPSWEALVSPWVAHEVPANGARAFTDRNGMAALEIADGQRPISLVVSAVGKAFCRTAPLTPENEPAVVVVTAEHVVTGELRFTGMTPRDAHILIAPASVPILPLIEYRQLSMSSPGSRLLQAGTVRPGRFSVSGLPSGPYNVGIVFTDDAGELVHVLRDGVDETEPLVFSVGGEDSTASHRVGKVMVTTVDDETGRPVPSIRANLTKQGAYLTSVGREGHCVFDDVTLGRWSLSVSAEGFVPYEGTITARTAGEFIGETIRLSRGVTVTGRIRSREGREFPANARIALTARTGRHGTAVRLEKDGSFVATGLIPGDAYVASLEERNGAEQRYAVVAPEALITLPDARETVEWNGVERPCVLVPLQAEAGPWRSETLRVDLRDVGSGHLLGMLSFDPATGRLAPLPEGSVDLEVFREETLLLKQRCHVSVRAPVVLRLPE